MNKIATLIPVLLLAGCSIFSAKPEIIPVMQTVPRAELNLPPVDTLSMAPVSWIVLTADNSAVIFEESGELAFIALTAAGYENLSVNNAKILQLIRQLQATVYAYDDYYRAQTDILDKYDGDNVIIKE